MGAGAPGARFSRAAGWAGSIEDEDTAGAAGPQGGTGYTPGGNPRDFFADGQQGMGSLMASDITLLSRSEMVSAADAWRRTMANVCRSLLCMRLWAWQRGE